MKARFYENGNKREILVLSTDAQYTHGITLDNGESIMLSSSDCCFYEIEQTTIDWEQRRYEIATAAMQGILSNSLFPKYSTEGYHRGNVVYNALSYADKLIEQLKKKQP